MTRRRFVYIDGQVVEKKAEEKRAAGPTVLGDYEAYDCPITGKMVDGRRDHRENLARHGCRILEKGEKEAAERNRERSFEERMDKILGDMA
jgi:hypothetical protein